MTIKNVNDEEFGQLGRVLDGVDFSDLISAMESTPLPEDVIYVASDEGLEKLKLKDWFSDVAYGQMPVQVGFCNGHNRLLNALEYHRSSEINVAATDMILLLGKQQDIKGDFTYDTSNVEAFLVPKGTAVEIYATTLHYAPCGVNGEGFKCVVVLPRGTNYELKKHNKTNSAVMSEDRLLAATNKWLIAHPDAHIEGAFEGLKGENISV
ncbi:MAG: DUF4867 family protein [Lachnospira sp.]